MLRARARRQETGKPLSKVQGLVSGAGVGRVGVLGFESGGREVVVWRKEGM